VLYSSACGTGTSKPQPADEQEYIGYSQQPVEQDPPRRRQLKVKRALVFGLWNRTLRATAS